MVRPLKSQPSRIFLHITFRKCEKACCFLKTFCFFTDDGRYRQFMFLLLFHNMFRINCKKGLNLRLFKAKKNIFRNVKYFKTKFSISAILVATGFFWSLHAIQIKKNMALNSEFHYTLCNNNSTA